MDDLISRQAAIDAIDRIRRTDNWQAAVSMALMDLPSAQPEERKESLCKKVRALCEESKIEFFFVGGGESTWSVTNDKHIKKIVECHKAQLSQEDTTKDATSDTISRQAAIDAVGSMLRRKFGIGGDLAEITLAGLPSAQPDLSEYSDKLWQAAYERGKAEAQPDLDDVYAHAETEAEARFHAEIVRCKDCKQFRRWIDTNICFCDITESERLDNDFCSRAERRTDE